MAAANELLDTFEESYRKSNSPKEPSEEADGD
jgi:hypothetical protein